MPAARAVPADFAEVAATRPFPELKEHYQCAVDTLRLWVRSQPPEWIAARERQMKANQAAANTRRAKTTYRRQSKPATAMFMGGTPSVSDTLAARAAHHLRRRIANVYDAGKVHGKALAGFYVVGRQTLPAAEMVELAKTKYGYNPDAWREVAA